MSEPPTSQLPPDGAHPDAETLAELQVGLLAPADADETAVHLGECASCRAAYAALERLPGRLAAAADVGPMPDDLVARLEAELAAEGRPTTVTITPQPAARHVRAGRDNRVLQFAAAAVLVLAATAVGVSTLQNGADDRTTSDAADARGEGPARELSAGSVPVLSTGTDYTQESVAAAVPGLLDRKGPEARLDEAPVPTPAEADDARARLKTGPALSGCVSAIADDPDTPAVELPTPLVVDVASFHGQPATVIVLPTPRDADRLDVYVVGPECSPADAKLLHFARVSKP